MRTLNPHRRKRGPVKVPYDPVPLNPLRGYEREYEQWALAAGRSAHTVKSRTMAIRRFILWCDERGLTRPQDITRPILERYQRHLYHYRKRDGAPLSVTAQLGLLTPLQAWFKWLARQNHILSNPASDLELPRKPKSLPRGILSVADVEHVLNQCEVTTLLGVRNRAILETLYSSGIRRMELVHLKLYEINLTQGTLMIRHGKGDKDRVVPIGERACAWVDKYLREVRAELECGHDAHALFLHDDGRPFPPGRLGDLVKRHLEHAGITHPGACHLFRHACATHMLENGADIRYIQLILGHADLATTQIYTQVSLGKLKEIHAATHPARLTREQGTRREPIERPDADALFASLAAEALAEEHDEASAE
ncbi:MAG: site-specific tyrosine recombinase XerC [Gammaproteobacteria bacterium]